VLGSHEEAYQKEVDVGVTSDPDNPPWTEEDFKNARLVEPGRPPSR